MFKLSDFQSALTTPVGNNQISNPIDVINTRQNLSKLGHFNGDTEQGTFDKPLKNAIHNFQQKEGLRTDSIINPGGPTERALNRALRGETNAFGDKQKAEINILSSVGKSQNNVPNDVEQIQKALGTLSFLAPSLGFEPTGIIDETTDEAIKSFQKRNNLRIDGHILPRGETESTINTALSSEGDNSGDGENDGSEGNDNTPAVPAPDVESEELPPPPQKTIPGTNIPDQGVPEQGFPNSPRFNPHAPKPNPDMDPNLERQPPISPYMPGITDPDFFPLPSRDRLI